MELKGLIQIPEKAINKEGVFYIRVQDTSLMDMPAETVAEIKVDKKAGLDSMPFSIVLPKSANDGAAYTLFVHLDLDHDKQLSIGDWLHDKAYHIEVAAKPLGVVQVSLIEIT